MSPGGAFWAPAGVVAAGGDGLEGVERLCGPEALDPSAGCGAGTLSPGPRIIPSGGRPSARAAGVRPSAVTTAGRAALGHFQVSLHVQLPIAGTGGRMPGPQGGTSLASIGSTSSGVTRISISTSLTSSWTFRNSHAQIRHVADPGKTAVNRFRATLQQAGNGHGLPGHHLHGRIGHPRGESRHGGPGMVVLLA